MTGFHENRFPGESDEYRKQRNALLEAEIELRRRVEEIAAMRRALPVGGLVRDDYVFEEGAADLTDFDTIRETRLSSLFEPGNDSLIIYNFMYAPDADRPCPMCTAFLDNLNGSAQHITRRANLAVVAKAPIPAIRKWAAGRGWHNLRLLSSGGNSYNRDYFGEGAEGDQWPMLNVFHRSGDGIVHTWGSELLLVEPAPGQDPRHMDQMWALWNVLDVTPEGRGDDWYPSPDYD